MAFEGLDPVIHSPKRLGAMAILSAADSVEFSFLREQLELSDFDLSKQMAQLVNAGYITARKSGYGRGTSTRFAMTAKGRRAYANHVAWLRATLTLSDGPVA